MTESHMFAAIYALQFIGGLLVLIPRTIPIGLTILGPIIANILLFHITLAPSGLPPGLVALVLWAIVFYGVRANFAGIFEAPLVTSSTRV